MSEIPDLCCACLQAVRVHGHSNAKVKLLTNLPFLSQNGQQNLHMLVSNKLSLYLKNSSVYILLFNHESLKRYKEM